MIVYGDPQYTLTRAAARERLKSHFNAAQSGGVDSARDLVIALGQIEQALADDAQTGGMLAPIMDASDRAAEYFVGLNLMKACAPEVLQACRDSVMPSLQGDGTLQIKVPEGFAFYSLYPEQYLTAAEIYSGIRPIGKILVVGIRSIGTTLSAIVKAALIARGFTAERITVRPKGHPFAREVHLDPSPKCDAVIIVDEGPGLSGSSMASVAAAFRAGGVNDITLFPGHANPPGHAASAETKRIWSETPVIVEPVLSAGKPNAVLNALHRETERLAGAPVCAIEDLSSGAWKKTIHCAQPIYTAPQFERSKFLIRCANERGVLWKFAGLGPGRGLKNLNLSAVARQNSLAAEGWTVPVLASCYGFAACEWLELPRPSSPPNETTCHQIAKYLLATSTPRLCDFELEQGVNRLREMTIHNLEEAGPMHLAEAARQLEPDIARISMLPSYGDGRMAPHEFMVNGGLLLKTDVWGHDFDHTMIGPQPLLWDIAGALVEWNIANPSKFLSCFRDFSVHPEDLHFYLFAYAAFRIGMSSLAGDREGEDSYRNRLEALTWFF